MTLTVAATKPIHETHRIAVDGAVDADAHILEPPTLWEEYIDPPYRDRALRIVRDEHGLEELEIGGRRSQMARRGFPATLGAMGAADLRRCRRIPTARTSARRRTGRWIPTSDSNCSMPRTSTSRSSTPPSDCCRRPNSTTPSSPRRTRAYNRWITEFCADSPRLVPTAHLSLGDPEAAASELERAVGDGASAYVCPFTHDAKPLGHPDHHVVFAAAQDLDVPFAIHPTFEPQWTKGERMGTWEHVKQLRLLASVTASDGVRQQFTTLFDFGVFDRFPRLKVLVLESGGGWLGYWLDRIDAVYGHTFIGNKVPLEHKPSDYVRERVWISCDPDERTIPHLAERFGADRFLWASDFPMPTTPPSTSTT
ncbi:MAG: amidohydrolase family protein [Ilumatobacteraceae bacterium]